MTPATRARPIGWASPDQTAAMIVTAPGGVAVPIARSDSGPPVGATRPLSHRELEVLAQLATGADGKEAARSLGISPQTVKNHVTSILLTLRARHRTHAVVLALAAGLLRLDDRAIPDGAEMSGTRERVPPGRPALGPPPPSWSLARPLTRALREIREVCGNPEAGVDSEDRLSWCIERARAALGESGRES